MTFNISLIYLFFFWYTLFYFALIGYNFSYNWCKIAGLTLSFSIFLIILNSFYTFDSFSTKFQYLESFEISVSYLKSLDFIPVENEFYYNFISLFNSILIVDVNLAKSS